VTEAGTNGSGVEPVIASRADRLALRVVQAGAIAVVVAAVTYRAFDLDRFFVPKELVLHLTALVAGLLTFAATARTAASSAERWLIALLGVSALSALGATNPWLAFRAVAITASSVALFVAGRRLADAGLESRLTAGLAFAVVLAAVTSLVQTYGVDLDIFASSRVPGGTLGNRNFVAHAAAFGLPLVLLAALRARSRAAFLRWCAGVALVSAALVLTRSRAAWLAFAAVAVVFVAATLLCKPLRRDARTWKRLGAIALVAGCGVVAALVIPNSLRWHSDNPYLDSVKKVADYRSGSGHGRLIQYERSLGLAVSHPLFGVGPGNWAVDYPGAVPKDDPSLDDSSPGTTSNPWPSSDWVAAISERGLLGVIAFGLVVFSLVAGGLRQLKAADRADAGLVATALLGTAAGAVVTGLFDAVLLLAVPALLVWPALGALWIPAGEPERLPRFVRRPILLAVLMLAALGAVRSAAQLEAMRLYASEAGRASLERAAAIDPGNYRVRLRLARIGARSERCRHARAARALYPNAAAANEAARGCGK
jgi:O-antigen ligase